jgi:hypothetical protein
MLEEKLSINFKCNFISTEVDVKKHAFCTGAGLAQSVYCLTTDWTTGVRSPAEAKDFSSSLCVQTSFETHPASYPMGTGCPFLGVNGGRGVTLTTYSHPMPRSRMS